MSIRSPAPVWWTAFATRFRNTCVRRSGSASRSPCVPRATVSRGRRGGAGRAAGPGGTRRVHAPGLHQLTGLRLGEGEHVVDEPVHVPISRRSSSRPGRARSGRRVAVSSSICPRSTVSGVRSSCEASETNSRWRRKRSRAGRACGRRSRRARPPRRRRVVDPVGEVPCVHRRGHGGHPPQRARDQSRQPDRHQRARAAGRQAHGDERVAKRRECLVDRGQRVSDAERAEAAAPPTTGSLRTRRVPASSVLTFSRPRRLARARRPRPAVSQFPTWDPAIPRRRAGVGW